MCAYVYEHMHINIYTFIFTSSITFLWKVTRFGNPCYLAAWDLGHVTSKRLLQLSARAKQRWSDVALSYNKLVS